MTERLHFHFSLSCIGGGNGNPRQCSCLENPRDREAWWASIDGVAQSWTRLSDFTFTPMDRSTKEKITKEKQTLNDTIDQLDLIDIYRTFHPKQ